LTSAERADSRRLPPVPAAADIGFRIAAAAREQAGDLVVYDERYRRIAYPMGDVHSFYGVCTDVVIRAYRAIGIDLQHAVQVSGVGSGDTNVDHRRTETLRRFFTRHGESLPVSSFAEDYRPGDIVTYYRPQNSGSRSHIAVVSDVLAPSGRYLIVHNRGWGPQLEDGLFVDEITGHYRYAGDGATKPPVRDLIARAPVPSAASTATQVVATSNAANLRPGQATLTRIAVPRPSPKLSRDPGPASAIQLARQTPARLPVTTSSPAPAPARIVSRRPTRAGEFEGRADFGLGR
ncbi:MAG: DUF1287 domain-containing protein, partial [Hyphomicrobiaceae bacterium]|nr:DUF1287 domain-containing protein [Hyphomicrobiaceae bacterium]